MTFLRRWLIIPAWTALYTNVFISDVLHRWLTGIPTLKLPPTKVFSIMIHMKGIDDAAALQRTSNMDGTGRWCVPLTERMSCIWFARGTGRLFHVASAFYTLEVWHSIFLDMIELTVSCWSWEHYLSVSQGSFSGS